MGQALPLCSFKKDLFLHLGRLTLCKHTSNSNAIIIKKAKSFLFSAAGIQCFATGCSDHERMICCDRKTCTSLTPSSALLFLWGGKFILFIPLGESKCMKINVPWMKFSKLQKPGALGHRRDCLPPKCCQACSSTLASSQQAGPRLFNVFWGHLGAKTDVLPEVFLPIWRKNKGTACVVELVCLGMEGCWKLLLNHFFPEAPVYRGLDQLFSLDLKIKSRQQPPILLETCSVFLILILLSILVMR